MPSLRCPCGFVHDLSVVPDDGWITVRDARYAHLLDAERVLAEAAASGEDDEAEDERRADADRAFVDLTGRLYECPRCGRLMWQRDGEDDYRTFSPDA
jgi:hypothetical protein